MAYMEKLPVLEGARVIVIDEGWLFFKLNTQSESTYMSCKSEKY